MFGLRMQKQIALKTTTTSQKLEPAVSFLLAASPQKERESHFERCQGCILLQAFLADDVLVTPVESNFFSLLFASLFVFSMSL
jgi:hypothetical protein